MISHLRLSRYGWLVLAAACGSDSEAARDGDDTAGGVDAREIDTPKNPWTVGVVASDGAGRQIQAAVLPDGTPLVAAYHEAGQPDGLCYAAEPTGGERTRWTLQYAEPDDSGGAGWRMEDVAGIWHLGAPRGFDLAIGSDGTPVIAALTGETDAVARYCGSNDLGLYRRAGAGMWAVSSIVQASNEAATGEPASDFGTVVGLWPALALDPGGALFVAYKDVHAGGLQGDDFTRADLEAAWQNGGGGFRHIPLDWGKGAGDFGAAAFDGEGRPLILYVNPRDDLLGSERGLWLMRGDRAGADWERVRLFAGGVGERPSLAAAGDEVWVAWYDGSVGLPYVARLLDPERFDDVDDGWAVRDIGDRVYDEGRHPSIARSEAGVVGVAYQRCGRASDGIGDCNPSKDAVVFAWRDGDIWEREIVQDEPSGLCGGFATLVFSGEAPVVFYQCQVETHDGGFVSELRAARREAL